MAYNIAEMEYTSCYPEVIQACTNKVNVMHTWQSLLNKEQVSQDLKDGFLAYLLIIRFLYLEITYII